MRKPCTYFLYNHGNNRIKILFTLAFYYLSWFSVDECQMSTKAALSLPFFKLDGGESIWWKACGLRWGQGEITHQIPSQAKLIELGGKKWFDLSPIKSE